MAEKQKLTNEDFEKFVEVLRAMCPGDYDNPESHWSKRACLAFDVFINKNWSPEDLEKVLDRFVKKHQSRDWYPRTFLEHYEEIFGTEGMVL